MTGTCHTTTSETDDPPHINLPRRAGARWVAEVLLGRVPASTEEVPVDTPRPGDREPTLIERHRVPEGFIN